jgi:prepilin-type N-terminal cleavage/methylation domain-containing protein/prepilin-type processing-associated H-X9-DG protein
LRAKGFTLIELLVVVAIIALLVSILVPALGKAREQARIVVCAANLRAIGVAWEFYLEDNGDRFPPFGQNIHWFYGGKHPSIASGNALPFRPLNPYAALASTNQDAAEIFRCPSDRDIAAPPGQTSRTNGYPTYDYYGNSYMLAFTLLYNDDPETYVAETQRPNRMVNVRMAPSRMMLAGDCQWYFTLGDAVWDANFHKRMDSVNLLFLDGHVSYTALTRGVGQTAEYSLFPFELPPEEEETDPDTTPPS